MVRRCTDNVQYGTSKNVGALGASGYGFRSYTTTNSGIGTVSGTTVYAVGVGTVQMRSNWYAWTPWITNGFGGYSGWSGSNRRLQMSNGGAGMSYFIYNVGNSHYWPSNSWAYQYPSGWTTGYQDGWHGNSGYIVFKACGTSNNYDGSNRCGDATYTWIGADVNRPNSEMGVSNTGNGWNMNHYWATNTGGRSGTKVKWVDTSGTVNSSLTGCVGPYDGRITTHMAINTPTPGGSWVWNAKYRVTAYKNGADGNYTWGGRSTIMTKDVESYVTPGLGNGSGIYQRMIPYSQSGVAASSHTNWC